MPGTRKQWTIGVTVATTLASLVTALTVLGGVPAKIDALVLTEDEHRVFEEQTAGLEALMRCDIIWRELRDAKRERDRARREDRERDADNLQIEVERLEQLFREANCARKLPL